MAGNGVDQPGGALGMLGAAGDAPAAVQPAAAGVGVGTAGGHAEVAVPTVAVHPPTSSSPIMLLNPAPSVVASLTTFGMCMGQAKLYKLGEDPPELTALGEAVQALFGAEPDTPSAVIAMNPIDDTSKAISEWQIMGDGNVLRAATITEKGIARMVDRYARLNSKSELELPVVSTQQVSTANADMMADLAGHVETLALAMSGKISKPEENTIALKEVVSQVLDKTAVRMTDEEVLESYKRYEKHFGKGRKPPEDEEPTVDQLSALRHLIQSGVVPYIDFSVWGPHGHRMVKKQKFMGQTFNHNGASGD